MDLKQERRALQRQTQGGAFDAWMQKFRRWLNHLFNKPEPFAVTQVERVFESEFIYLKLLKTEYSDELSTRIRHWLAISKHPDLPVDVVITCDKLKRSRQLDDLTGQSADMRFSVVFISKYLINGHRRKVAVLVTDLDCVPAKVFKFYDVNASNQVFVKKYKKKVNVTALKITDSLALQLVSEKRKLSELKLLLLLSDERVESMQTRKAVSDRWLAVLMGYYRQVLEDEK